MCDEYFYNVYRLYIQKGGVRSAFLELHLKDASSDDLSTTLDVVRNERELYVALFSAQCRGAVEHVYRNILHSLSGMRFEDSDELISALIVIQAIAATAIWRYECEIGEMLEQFARSFDRLDVASERLRLYSLAQSHNVQDLSSQKPIINSGNADA